MDPHDEDIREQLAKAAYMRERREDVAADREHEMRSDVSYFVLEWESLSPWAQRPYRTTVAEVLDQLETAGVL